MIPILPVSILAAKPHLKQMEMSAPKAFELRLDARWFSGSPEGAYGDAVASYHATPEWKFKLAASSTARNSTVTAGSSLNFGGSDIEFGTRYMPVSAPGVDLGFGVSAPNTADRRKADFTYYAGYKHSWDTKTSSELAVLGVTGANALTGIKISADLQTSEDTKVHVWGGCLFGGDTTHSTSTGNGIRTFLGSAEVEWMFGETKQYSLSFGVTNTLGPTTATSLSSSLGGHAALKVGGSIRF